MIYLMHQIVNTFTEKEFQMTLVQKKWLIILVVALAGFLLGRLSVRALFNLMMGGTLFGGNFL